MRILLAIFLFLNALLSAVQADFDVAIIGTSPISMLEAIYHLSKNERVLILEGDERCGGAWKSIDICGINNVDLGCHLIGKDKRIKDFFEQYFGCQFVCMQHPYEKVDDTHQSCQNGYYFSRGCYELVSLLENRILSHDRATLLHRKLDSIFIDADREIVELWLGSDYCTTSKLIITGCSHFQVKNPAFSNESKRNRIYPHLYFLIEDETPSRFTYLSGICTGMSRAMNLTPFLDFPEKNLQLIVVQIHSNQDSWVAEEFFKAFIKKNYLSANAKIIRAESCEYRQGNINSSALSRLGGKLIEVLESTAFSSMNRHLERWKTAMTPLAYGRELGSEGLQ